jgi:hypothetical protein
MAYSKKYGKVNIPNIGEDEPVFILRAQDKLAADSIQDYKSRAARNKSKVVETIDKEIDAFKKWHGNKKLPD